MLAYYSYYNYINRISNSVRCDPEAVCVEGLVDAVPVGGNRHQLRLHCTRRIHGDDDRSIRSGCQ